MTTPTNWPNPERPYYPLNSDVSGWHWIEGAGDIRPVYWGARTVAFYNHSGAWAKVASIPTDAKYHGPVLTPTQIAEMLAGERERIIKEVVPKIARDIAELADRNSPDAAPEMMLVTADEMIDISTAAIRNLGAVS